MDRVLEYIQENQMIEAGDKIIVGVSGGPDSVCLLFLLKRYKKMLDISLAVVHMEHGIRGKESAEDAAFVENLCRDWEIPFFLYRKDVPKLSREWKCSEEEAGRRVRYEAFEEVRERIGAEKIAVAHNQDDQAETILFHLARGSGLLGLTGIQPVRGRIIRPLLCLSRAEIEEILEKEGLLSRTDATNREIEYTRNRIRLHILPLLREELNTKASEHIARTGEMLSSIEDYMISQAALEAKQLMQEKNGLLYLDRRALHDKHEAMKDYILRCCLMRALGGDLHNISFVHIADLKRLCDNQSGRRLNLPRGLAAYTENDMLVIGPREALVHYSCFKMRDTYCSQGGGLSITLPDKGEVWYGKYHILTALEPYKNEIIPEKMYTKWFDYDTIKNTVQIRSRMEGDYLTVTADGKRKTLKKYLIDEKIPAGERGGLCLLADESHILWVIGHRISEAYKVTEKTQRVLKVQVMEE